MPAKCHYFLGSPLLSKLIIVITFALASGCASVQITEYEHANSNANYSQVKDGLSVSIDPITDHSDSKKYFGKDILESGVLAVHISIENDSSSTSYIFEKEKIAFRERGGIERKSHYVADAGMRKSEQDAIKTNQAAAVAYTLVSPAALPLYLSGLSDIRNLNDIKYNMISKELKTKIVHPNENIDGFLYFSIKNSKSLKAKDNRIDISYVEMGNDNPGIFQFIF